MKADAAIAGSEIPNRPMPKLTAYLQLLRIPTVFTAMADIFLGFAMTHGSFRPPLDFALLLVASSSLYLGGMVFNDVFDRGIDSEERPGRPIPSGRISVLAAVRLGILLFAAGLGASQVVGVKSLEIAAGLGVLILAYDALLKKTPLGPLAMGGCRFLNVLLGASAPGALESVPAFHVLAIAAGLGVYITGVTWFARQEAVQSDRSQLLGAMGLINFGLTILLAFVLNTSQAGAVSGVVLLGVILLTIDRRLAAAVFHPAPQLVQAGVKTCLLSLVLLDASLVFFTTMNASLALATAALLVPAVVLSRAIPMT